MPVPPYFKPKPKTFDPCEVAGLGREDLVHALEGGARFVNFQWVVSLLILTIRRNSPVYFVRPGESAFGKSIPFSILTLICGWWGLPWGILWTPKVLYENSRGGIDITPKVLQALGWNRTVPNEPVN